MAEFAGSSAQASSFKASGYGMEEAPAAPYVLGSHSTGITSHPGTILSSCFTTLFAAVLTEA